MGANQTFAASAAACVAIAAGVLLLIGFLTPFAGILLGLGGGAILLSILSAPDPNLLDSRVSMVFVVVVAAAIVFLGPGALSLDSRLFGRREIIIPSGPGQRKY